MEPANLSESMLEQQAAIDGAAEEKQQELGQFLTPKPVADFMASLFGTYRRHVELLDAGAGAGSLTAALVRRLCSSRHKPETIAATVYEIDPDLIGALQATLDRCRHDCERVGIKFAAHVFNEDFVAATAPLIRGDLFARRAPRFNAAIVNPPYRKIRSNSHARLLLRLAGIETSNLYTGFVALITKLLVRGGELVAITPRSFCNGPYFKPFRVDLLETLSLRRLHVFESRSSAFSDDEVLQENIIVHAVKAEARPRNIIVSSSSGEPNGVVVERTVGYEDVVSSDDSEKFIHLVIDDRHKLAKSMMARLSATLAELGLSVSTGRVVDFRANAYLRREPSISTAPLIYPCHFSEGFVNWPKHDSRKPNAIVNDRRTQELLIPAGIYVLVKRFTAKEERRRLVACIYDPDRVRASFVGFENHLNYYHNNGRGMTMELAKGLAAFLNSSVLDIYFRQFSGHTQVNATDLRSLKYPSKAGLVQLGRRIKSPQLSQSEIDGLVEETCF